MIECTEADIYGFACDGCFATFATIEIRQTHEAACPAVLNLRVQEVLDAQAIDDAERDAIHAGEMFDRRAAQAEAFAERWCS